MMCRETRLLDKIVREYLDRFPDLKDVVKEREESNFIVGDRLWYRRDT